MPKKPDSSDTTKATGDSSAVGQDRQGEVPELKATPGAWRASKNEDGWCVRRELPSIVAITGWGQVMQSEDDAYLIAAAWDLYEALDMALRTSYESEISEAEPDSWRGKAKAALAKARGER